MAMTSVHPTARGAQGARINLSRFVHDQADKTADELGFGWVGVPDAPSTYQQLRGAFEHSKRTGELLPISNLFCDDTIYVEPADNIAFRFWHDTSHCRLGLSFALQDEWELSLWHLARLEEAGFSPASLEHQLFRVDALGQIILLALAGRFPFNQGDFVRTCGELGMDAGILTELRRIS
jgi:hypothetical protein